MTLEEACERLQGYIDEDGSGNLTWALGTYMSYLDWDRRSPTATLDGDFTAEDLEALAIYMKAHRRVPSEV